MKLKITDQKLFMVMKEYFPTINNIIWEVNVL